MPALINTVLLLLASLGQVLGHGLLVDPPARNTIWRLGFPNPVNYDDNGLNCGGFSNQWDGHNGKCGVCGDPYQGPRKHEAGYPGGFANGLIGQHYMMGDVIKVQAKITANHLGYITFKLCPVNDPSVKATQQCMDRYQLTDGKGKTEFNVYDQIGNSPGIVTATLRLPQGLTCKQCVMQWTYVAGNNAGKRQETFVNCADIKISRQGGPKPTAPAPGIDRSTNNYKTDSQGRPITGKAYDCDLVSPYNAGNNVQKTYNWCISNCIKAIPSQRTCPGDRCRCFEVDEVSTNRPWTDRTTSRQQSTTPKNQGDVRNPSEWTCELVSPYNRGTPAKVRSLHKWCVDSCVKARPQDRHCPAELCNCYRNRSGPATNQPPRPSTQRPTWGTTQRSTRPPRQSTTQQQRGGKKNPSEWTCDLVSPYDMGRNAQGLQQWCVRNCILSNRNCPSTHCNCYPNGSRRQPTEPARQRTTPSRPGRGRGPSDTSSSSRRKLRTREGYCTLVSMRDERSPQSDAIRQWCANTCIPSNPMSRFNRQRCPTYKCNCVRN